MLIDSEEESGERCSAGSRRSLLADQKSRTEGWPKEEGAQTARARRYHLWQLLDGRPAWFA